MCHQLKPFFALLLVSLFSLPAGSQNKLQLPQWKVTEDEAQELTGGAKEHKLNQALEEARALHQGDSYPQSECLFELGLYYFDVGKVNEAEQYFSLAADEKKRALEVTLCKGGSAPGNLPAYTSAMEEHSGKVHDLANCLSWQGRACFSQKKYEEAARIFARAIELLDTTDDANHESILLPDTLLRAARIQRLLNHLNEAKKMELRAHYILSHRAPLDR